MLRTIACVGVARSGAPRRFVAVQGLEGPSVPRSATVSDGGIRACGIHCVPTGFGAIKASPACPVIYVPVRYIARVSAAVMQSLSRLLVTQPDAEQKRLNVQPHTFRKPPDSDPGDN